MAVRQPIWRDGVYGSAGVLALSAVAFLAACTDTSTSLLPSALAPPAALQKKAGQPSNLEPLAAAHKTNPADTVAAFAYAKALRTSGLPCRRTANSKGLSSKKTRVPLPFFSVVSSKNVG